MAFKLRSYSNTDFEYFVDFLGKLLLFLGLVGGDSRGGLTQ